MYYLNGASNQAFAKLCANSLLLWKVIERGVEDGYEELDFVGPDSPQLAKFKGSFGGSLVEYVSAEWASTLLVRILRVCYGSYVKGSIQKLRLLLRICGDKPFEEV